MTYIDDVYYKKRLKDNNINIKTKYVCGDKVLVRNTDNSYNDDIKDGIRVEKLYYKDNIFVHREKDFDSRISYTFISLEQEKSLFTCPNCGLVSKFKDMDMCCPFCNTYYNIEYTNKDLGSKYHYDRILRSNTYRIITYIIGLIICTILSYLFIKNTSRTFNDYDIYKVFIYGVIASLVFYYFFYIVDAYTVLGPIKRYKDKENLRQKEFWDRTKIDKSKFFNNLNYEVRKYFYSLDNVIDYDIIDYVSFEGDSNKVLVSFIVRIVYFKNGKIKSKEKKMKLSFKYNKEYMKLKKGDNVMRCNSCGASLSVLKEHCEFCGSKLPSLQEWCIIE